MTGMPLTILFFLKYEYTSWFSSTSSSQQTTLSGDEAKKASTAGLIFLQGPHQVAPIFTMTSPGLFSKSCWNFSTDSNPVMMVFVNDVGAVADADAEDVDICFFVSFVSFVCVCI